MCAKISLFGHFSEYTRLFSGSFLYPIPWVTGFWHTLAGFLDDLLKMLESAEKDGLASNADVDAGGTLSTIQKMITNALQKKAANLGVETIENS